MAADKAGNASHAGTMSRASPESRVPARIVRRNPQRDTRFLPESVNQSDIQRGAVQLAHDMEHQSCGRDGGKEIGCAGGETTGAGSGFVRTASRSRATTVPIWAAPDTRNAADSYLFGRGDSEVPHWAGYVTEYYFIRCTGRNAGHSRYKSGQHCHTLFHILPIKLCSRSSRIAAVPVSGAPWIEAPLPQQDVNPQPQYAGSTDKSKQEPPQTVEMQPIKLTRHIGATE